MNERKYEAILVKQEDGLTTITLNRPEKRNAMSPQLQPKLCNVDS